MENSAVRIAQETQKNKVSPKRHNGKKSFGIKQLRNYCN
jgi:hypothetical protein